MPEYCNQSSPHFFDLLPETDPIIVERQLKAVEVCDGTVGLEVIRNPAIFTNQNPVAHLLLSPKPTCILIEFKSPQFLP